MRAYIPAPKAYPTFSQNAKHPLERFYKQSSRVCMTYVTLLLLLYVKTK